MKRKTKYYLVGLLLLAAFIFGYHYYAAHQAETQIDEAIRKQTAQSKTPPFLTYESVDVSPFSGDVRLSEPSVIDSSGIYRARSVDLDLTYGDFLNIYFRSPEYSLKRLDKVGIRAIRPSFVHHASFREVKFSSLSIDLNGNIRNILGNLISSVPLQTPLSVELHGQTFTYHDPGSLPGIVEAETVRSEHSFSPKASPWWLYGSHRLKMNQLMWAPPDSFQQQYGFFIRGFGYDTNRIPADSLQFSIRSVSPADTASFSLGLFTELFDAKINSLIQTNPYALDRSVLKNGSIRVTDASEQFDVFIKNLEQLLGKELSYQSKEILRFSGTVGNPQFTIQ